eukprot:jgi/Tetstr1/438732/TSEL_002928.t1
MPRCRPTATDRVAIFAQSMGGGGGNGAVTATGAISIVDVNIGVGGNGGAGGTGGTVNVSNTGKLTTKGNYSSADLRVGQCRRRRPTAGDGGIADAVKIDNSATIETSGYNAFGLAAQSVGGDGGMGGAGLCRARITRRWMVARRLPSRRLGGNGGAGGASYAGTLDISTGNQFESNVQVGGNGGSGAIGSDVKVTNSKTLTTTGGNAHGIFAQSVGGDGSVGGSGGTGGNGEPGLEGWLADVYDVYEKLNTAKEIYEQFKEFPESLYESLSVDVGGGAGEASDGGDVTVTNDGDLTTTGDSATAIYAQSVGRSSALPMAARAGDGGDVTVTLGSDGAIVTYGANAHGIFAYSIGGGGGAEGELKAGDGTGSIGSEGRDGLGGLVTVDVNYLVDVGGEGAVGVYAQSVSGGAAKATPRASISRSMARCVPKARRVDAGGTVTNDLIIVDVHGKDDAIELGGTVETHWFEDDDADFR